MARDDLYRLGEITLMYFTGIASALKFNADGADFSINERGGDQENSKDVNKPYSFCGINGGYRVGVMLSPNGRENRIMTRKCIVSK